MGSGISEADKTLLQLMNPTIKLYGGDPKNPHDLRVVFPFADREQVIEILEHILEYANPLVPVGERHGAVHHTNKHDPATVNAAQLAEIFPNLKVKSGILGIADGNLKDLIEPIKNKMTK